MKAIIIAAGSGQRISKYVKSIPKSLINVNGKAIIDYQIRALKQAGINEIIIVTGKFGEKFKMKDIHYVKDPDYQNHDILGSLMEAKEFLKDDVIVLYSDIIFEFKIIKQVLDSKENISIAIDNNWEQHYEERTEHPKSEAENVLINEKKKIVEIRKNIENKNNNVAEFLGIMKLSEQGGDIFIKKYENAFHKGKKKFHDASSISKAYLTDMLQELIDQGVKIEPVFISGKWSEIDTMQDLKRAEKLFSN